MNNFTKAQINQLAQIGWNRPAADDEKAVYETKPASEVLQIVLDSAPNKEIRTKAAHFDQVSTALKAAYTLIDKLKAEGQGAVSQAEIDALAKKADDLEQEIKNVNK